ncbi:unnamed protein product [Hyaloperonospora brassicae]|uniref:EF-hand domain-containing protein n=1 Tax=Hyaloperonospora brassicae TaxID=162125 RepID=A0AAV0U0N7_HYABA|nr:unnamed protein product [Hyaloperonospora brassicae]
MPQRVSAVTLLLDDEAHEVLLCPQTPVAELLQCITSGFSSLSRDRSKTPVALQHVSSRVFYPLSLLCRCPELFEIDAYRVVTREAAQTRSSRNVPGRRREAQAVTKTHERRAAAAAATTFGAATSDPEQAIDFSDFELSQLVNVFTQFCPTGALDRRAFERCLEKILAQSGRYDPQARAMFTRLFRLFATSESSPDDAVVDVVDLLGAASVFASGERDEKIQLTFELYDMDKDGFLSKEEMTRYLTAVFRVISLASPELLQQNNMDPADMAIVTANQCFAESTLNHEGRLSFEAFRAWYLKPGPTQLVAARCSNSGSNKKCVNGIQLLKGLDHVTLGEITGLSALSASDVFSIFGAASTQSKHCSKKVLARTNFKQTIFTVLESMGRKATREVDKFLDRLYDAFDEDGSDSVDYVELSSGLSVLCGGLTEDKVMAAFVLVDTDGDGCITQPEMEAYLTSVFRVMYEASTAMTQAVGIDAKTLARLTTMQAFDEMDMDRDGKLSLKELRSWYGAAGRPCQPHLTSSPADSQQQPVVHDTHAVGTASFVASLTGLCDRAPSDVFEVIAAKVNEDGVLSRESFFSIVDELVEDHAARVKRKPSVGERDQLQRIIENVFDGFDTDHDGFVDFCELSSGISVLCSGSQEEKIKAAFTLFDVNHDGCISRDEMETYLASVYRIVFMMSPTISQQLHVISPEELARITTADAFTFADANEDDSLSFDEFTKWYSTQSGSLISMHPHQEATLLAVGDIVPPPQASLVRSRGGLNEMKELTNLGKYDGKDVFELFQASADAEGNISQPVYFRCFNKLLASDKQVSRDAQVKTQQLLEELFELFDVDKNGVVDVQELGAGLSILCGGNRAEKTKAMFTLYDVNHDGYVSPDEMTSYLTSIFKIMYKASPELETKTGMMPDQLASVTTRECFGAFDHNRDGRLSLDEFSAWFEQQNLHVQNQHVRFPNGSSNALLVRPAQSSMLDLSNGLTASIVPLEFAKKLSGLGDVSLDDVSTIFASAIDGGKRVSRRIFDECFYERICKKHVPMLSAGDHTQLHGVMDRIFSSFDIERKGVVDFIELMGGLSILCGASSRDENVLAALKLYDVSGDGVVSIDEMTHYLGSVFKLLYGLDPACRQLLVSSTDALAAATAGHTFGAAGVDHDGRLSLGEFQKWYAKLEQVSFTNIVAPLDLQEVRQLTNLGNLDVGEVFERLAEHANNDGMLTRTDFDNCFSEVIEMAHLQTQIEKVRAKMVADRLYDVFECEENGQVDFSELASGLSVLCKGARDARVKAAFRLYDFNADGFISKEDTKRFFTSIFKVMYEVQTEMRQETGMSAEQLGAVTAEQAFLEADMDRDGKLSYDEFLTWYNSPAQARIGSAVSNDAVVNPLLRWIPLDEVRRLTNFAQYKPDEVFEIFAEEADESGLLSRDAFNKSFCKVSNGCSSKAEGVSDLENQKKLHEIMNGLFDLFDHSNSEAVDFGELASGLSVLCGGTKDQKVEAAFCLFDYNGDGYISLEEMTRYLTSVFRVLFQVSLDARSLGVTPEELGEVTAQQAFAEADRDHDGQLTLKEFKSWYQQPSGIGEVAKSGKQLFSLTEASRQTNPQDVLPVEVSGSVAAYVDEQGYVSREAFGEWFRITVSTSQDIKSEEHQHIDLILGRLFELFDVDKNGIVNFSEISSGLSVLYGWPSEEKTRAAFALVDYNADGYISMEEMTRYLASVFRVLKEASPAVLDHFDCESPEELGVRTARQAFIEADLDLDGRLSFPEFRKWYTYSNAATVDRLIQNNVPSRLLLCEVRHLTRSGLLSKEHLLGTFAKFVPAEGAIDCETVIQAFNHFRIGRETDDSVGRLRFLVERIFAQFDRDNDGLVDARELASGLSALFGESWTEKIRAGFDLYDMNYDGRISLGEMRFCLTLVFKVLFELKADNETQMDVTPEELGEITAEQVFAEADLDKDGSLAFIEFSQWCLHTKTAENMTVNAAFDDQEEQQRIRNVQHNRVNDWVNLDVVKQMTNLEKFTADEVFEILANRCSDDGTLSREVFEECFEQLVDEQYKNDETNLARLRLILNRLFIIFDEGNNGTVNVCELGSGLSVLCRGSREEKVRAAFSLLGLDQDGFVLLDEVVRYLASVFKVLYETNPGTYGKLGYQPGELATITAKQCFLIADLDETGRMEFDNFVAWYNTMLGFEAPMADVGRSFLVQQLDKQQGANGDTSESQDDDGLRTRQHGISDSRHTGPPSESLGGTVSSAGGKECGSSSISAAPASFLSDKICGMRGLNGNALLSPKSSSTLSMNSSNMEHVRHLLKLDTYEVNDVLEIFAEASPSGELTFEAFKKCFDQIIRLAGGHEAPEERHEADAMVRRLFRVFDSDNKNTVDFGVLASGLSVLSGSSMDEKLRAAFQLHDISGNGYITQQEMVNYMTSIFKVMYETTDSAKTKMGVSPEELARATAEQCFGQAEISGDKKLSFEEFKKV